jgi:hypothetical protein
VDLHAPTRHAAFMHEAYESFRPGAPGSRPYGTERGNTHVKTKQALDDALTTWSETLSALCRSLVSTLRERSSEPDISIFDVLTKPRFWTDGETETARHLVGHGWVLQTSTGSATTGGLHRAPTAPSTDMYAPPRTIAPTGWCLLESASIVEYTGTAPVGERRNGEGRRIDFATDRVQFPPSSAASSGRYHGSNKDYRADLLRHLGVPEPYTREHLDAVAPIHREIALALGSWNNLLGAYARGLDTQR